MKKIKLITMIVLLGMVISNKINAQQGGGNLFFKETTEKKTGVDKDVEIAKNILETLFQQETGLMTMGGVKGMHIKEFGAVFTIPGHSFNSRVINTSSGHRVLTGQVYLSNKNFPQAQHSHDEPKGEGRNYDLDSLNKGQTQAMISVCKTFLVDYGGLINGLSREDKIIVTDKDIGFDSWRFISPLKDKRKSVSVEIKYADILQHKSGKISRDQLMSRVEVTEGTGDEKTSKDVELLASIFNRLYKSDLSDTYYLFGKTYYEYLDDFGVIYQMRVYSSSGGGSEGYRITTLGMNNLSSEERDEKVKELYPKFKDQLIRNIIQYGSTLNSLAPDQIVMFNVKLTECDGCELPKNLEVSVKYGVLQKVRNGSLTAEKAAEEFNVVEKGKQ